MPIQVQAPVNPSFQSLFNNQIDRLKIREFIAGNPNRTPVTEQMSHSIYGNLFLNDGVEFGSIGNHADVRTITLITGPTVCDAMEG